MTRGRHGTRYSDSNVVIFCIKEEISLRFSSGHLLSRYCWSINLRPYYVYYDENFCVSIVSSRSLLTRELSVPTEESPSFSKCPNLFSSCSPDSDLLLNYISFVVQTSGFSIPWFRYHYSCLKSLSV